MNFFRSLHLNRISTQIAILIVVSLIAIHALITVIVVLNHRDSIPQDGGPSEFVSFVRLVAGVAPDKRAGLIDDIARGAPSLQLQASAAFPDDTGPVVEDEFLHRIEQHLGPGFHVKRLDPRNSFDVAVRLPDGTALTGRLLLRPSPFGGPIMFTVLFVVVSVTLLAIWATRALREPLTGLAKATAAFNLDGEVAALPERGPEEIRAVAKAFNGMRARIRKLVDDRTRMLAAMGHDLRTPITRLRLRTEFIQDEEVRGQILRDLDQMMAMVDGVLSFLRDGQAREPISKIDVASALQTICDQYADIGHNVSYSGLDHMVITGRPNELQRAVGNLVDNAVRHGCEVVVRLARSNDEIIIAVEDDGPGIPDEQKGRMLEAFVRGDEARTMNDRRGFGLGLSIARAVAEQHGGTLMLHNRIPHGLSAVIHLPAV